MPAAPSQAGARPLPWVVVALSLLCSAGFLHALTLDAAAIASWVERWGLVSRELLREVRQMGFGPRWLTPFSALLLHDNLLHLCGNLFYLWLFGEALEAVLGPLRFAGLFLACALASGGVHVAASPEAFLPALGASGAISGLMGAYLVVVVPRGGSPLRSWHPLGLPPLFFLGLWGLYVAVAALAVPQSYAIWAHAGGFAAGLVACALLPAHAAD